MKTILTAINAKYIHTNLAVRYLYNTIKDFSDSEVMEFSINDNIFTIERKIILANPKILCFSCYIWNIRIILNLCSDIKRALPNVNIILGGPEVSYDAEKIISENPLIDYIICGEGETSFPALIKHIIFGSNLTDGVYFDNGNRVVKTYSEYLPDFSVINIPYETDFKDAAGKIIYYESSRGCPYNCKYCLSGEGSKVRFKDVESVKKDLDYFSDNGISLVKFVDRTFNADKKRAKEIWKYISEMNTNTKFHMEITGEILDDESVGILKKIRGDNLQFEIGVQSTNSDTIRSINRVCNMDILFKYIRMLLSETDIHIHLDLIVGLPNEDFESFKKSFNDVVGLRPHVLQIGFLKLLKGSLMREEASKYEIIYREYAPYEIISNKFISYDEIIYLKDFEYIFDKYYNSESFNETVNYLFKKFDNKFELFCVIVDYYRNNNLIGSSLSKENVFRILYDCFNYFGDEFVDAIKYDYITALHPGKLPSWLISNGKLFSSDMMYSLLKNEEIKKKYMSNYYNIPAKIIMKHVHFESFSYGVLMFDYKDDNVYNITQITDNQEV